MPIPTRGRHHTPSLLFGLIARTSPPQVRLVDDDLLLPVDWVDTGLSLAQDQRVLVAEVAPQQWAIISVLEHVEVV